MRKALLAFAVLGFTTGCYHATIETGRTPSPQVIEKPWASSFIGGLVPPSTVETAQKCTNGVARVETQMSFLNLLANAITWGIYSPMNIKVTCAAAGGADALPQIEAGKDKAGALAAAVKLSAEKDTPVLVKF